MIKKSIKDSFIALFFIIACFCCFLACIQVKSTSKAFAANGDSDSFVEISCVDDFFAINNNLSANYILKNDIDLSTATVDVVINNEEDNPFSGIFDGGGYTIKGLKITDATTQYVGLFGYVSGEIRNLTVEGEINLKNESQTLYVGGIVGYLSGQIKNCVNNVFISTESTVSNSTYETPKLFLGGFAGKSMGRIENSVNNATIEDSPTPIDYSEMFGYIGGIVGFNASGVVSSCNNNGCVKLLDNATNGDSKVSTYYIGGISGYSVGTVTTCKNSESVAVINEYNRISLTHRFVAGITGARAERLKIVRMKRI